MNASLLKDIGIQSIETAYSQIVIVFVFNVFIEIQSKTLRYARCPMIHAGGQDVQKPQLDWKFMRQNFIDDKKSKYA